MGVLLFVTAGLGFIHLGRCRQAGNCRAAHTLLHEPAGARAVSSAPRKSLPKEPSRLQLTVLLFDPGTRGGDGQTVGWWQRQGQSTTHRISMGSPLSRRSLSWSWYTLLGWSSPSSYSQSWTSRLGQVKCASWAHQTGALGAAVPHSGVQVTCSSTLQDARALITSAPIR